MLFCIVALVLGTSAIGSVSPSPEVGCRDALVGQSTVRKPSVDATGRPVYGAEPIPTYADEALSPGRRARLEREIPGRLAEGRRELDAISRQVYEAYGNARDTIQFERVSLRLGMAKRLCEYIAKRYACGTTSGICQAESGLEALSAFCAYFREEISAWSTYPLAPHVKPLEFNIRDFGASGDGVADDEPAFRAALLHIQRLGGRPSVLRVPAGDYLLRAKKTDGAPIPVLTLPAVENCVVEGAGPDVVRFVYDEYDGDGLSFDRWKNSAFRNVEVSWRENPFSEGEVESVDRTGGSLVLLHHGGTLKPNDARFARVGYPNSCMLFGKDGHPVKTSVLWYDYRCDDLGGGRYRMFFDPGQESTKTMPVEPGQILVFPDRNNMCAAVRCRNSELMTFENVWIRNSRAGAFTTSGCYMPTIARCRIFPKDPRFCLSTNADGNFTAVGTAILNCEFVNMNDDGSNGNNRGRLLVSHDLESGAWTHDKFWGRETRAGGFVQVISSLDGQFLFNTRVRRMESLPGSKPLQQTIFEDEMPASVRSYTSLGIEPYDALTSRKIKLGTMKTPLYPDQFYVTYANGLGYLCCGNAFANIRGVGIQVQSSNSLVQSNRVDNVYRGIELSGLLHYQEGPPPYNVVVRGNCIRYVNRGIKSTFMTANHPPALTTPMTGLLIEDNDIDMTGEKSLVLANAEDAIVRNNNFGGGAKIEIRVCRDIELSGNRAGNAALTPGENATEACSVGIRWGVPAGEEGR